MNTQLIELVKHVLESEHTVKEKEKLLNGLRELGGTEENQRHFSYVIWTLAVVAISIPIEVLWSLWKSVHDDVPSGLLSLGSAAVGALAAFLSPTRSRGDDAHPTELQASSQQNKPPDVPAQDGNPQAGDG